jgi:hypothetical protein
MSVLCKAVVSLLLALPAIAQSQAFEVISIKPASGGDPRNMRVRAGVSASWPAVSLEGDLTAVGSTSTIQFFAKIHDDV